MPWRKAFLVLRRRAWHKLCIEPLHCFETPKISAPFDAGMESCIELPMRLSRWPRTAVRFGPPDITPHGVGLHCENHAKKIFPVHQGEASPVRSGAEVLRELC